MVEAAALTGVHSGELEIWVSIDHYEPKNPEGVKMRLLGTFLELGKRAFPRFDFAISSVGRLAGHNVYFHGGLLADSEYAVANYEDQTYEPPRPTFEALKSKLEEAQTAGDEGNAVACLEAGEGLEVGSLVHELTDEGRVRDFDGTYVTRIGANLDLPALLDALVKLEEQPQCAAQLEAAGVPSAAELQAHRSMVEGRFDEAHMEISVDKNGVFRDLSVRVTNKNKNGEGFLVELHIRLQNVNKVSGMAVTHGYAPFDQMLNRLGLDRAALDQADGGEIVTGFLQGISEMMRARGGF